LLKKRKRLKRRLKKDNNFFQLRKIIQAKKRELTFPNLIDPQRNLEYKGLYLGKS